MRRTSKILAPLAAAALLAGCSGKQEFEFNAAAWVKKDTTLVFIDQKYALEYSLFGPATPTGSRLRVYLVNVLTDSSLQVPQLLEGWIGVPCGELRYRAQDSTLSFSYLKIEDDWDAAARHDCEEAAPSGVLRRLAVGKLTGGAYAALPQRQDTAALLGELLQVRGAWSSQGILIDPANPTRLCLGNRCLRIDGWR